MLITLARREGVVADLDDFVLDTACANARALAKAHGPPVDVHVNISAGRLGVAGIETTVARALDQHRLRPHRLVLEISETSAIIDVDTAAAALQRLRTRGVRIALDDFGSGVDAFARLLDLPVDIIKLDGAFTDVKAESGLANTMCRWLLRICSEFDATVVAEGVRNGGGWG